MSLQDILNANNKRTLDSEKERLERLRQLQEHLRQQREINQAESQKPEADATSESQTPPA